MVLRTKNVNIFGVHWNIRLLGGDLEKPIYRGRLPKKGGIFVFEGGVVDTTMPTMIILSHFELSRIDLPKLNSSILMEILTIPVGQVDEFYFHMHYPIKAWLFEKTIFELVYLFHIVLKNTCIILWQMISLKKVVVLSLKFTILTSWSLICIPLILLSALMRLESTSAAVFYNDLDSWHHWRTHIGVKGSNRRPFILILDSILVYATSNVNEYVSIFKLMQRKKDKTFPRILQKDFYSVYFTHQLWHK